MGYTIYEKKKGLVPVLCNAGSNAVHHHYFGCPVCGAEVGGFTITGDGENDWGTHNENCYGVRRSECIVRDFSNFEIERTPADDEMIITRLIMEVGGVFNPRAVARHLVQNGVCIKD